jgi:hypothetical protein
MSLRLFPPVVWTQSFDQEILTRMDTVPLAREKWSTHLSCPVATLLKSLEAKKETR